MVLGECEEVLVELAAAGSSEKPEHVSILYRGDSADRVPRPHASNIASLPALSWSREVLEPTFASPPPIRPYPGRPGAELEASRGCPYHCTFCAKDDFRDAYRKRPLATVLEELDGLLAQGVQYVYFIDEIFLPDRPLLEALCERRVQFGVQLRIDNWSTEMLDLLGRAGCVSIEAGIESLTEQGRSLLAKRCRLTTEELTALLVHAKRAVPSFRPTCSTRKPTTPRRARLARIPEGARCVGQRSRSPVLLPGLTRLPHSLGKARRSSMGKSSRRLSRAMGQLQRSTRRTPTDVGHPRGARA